MRTKHLPSLVTAAVLLAAFGFGQPEPGPYVDTVNVEVINVDVYVRDQDGEPVEGLTADDFELLVDRKAVSIANFYAVDAGSRRVAQGRVPVATGELPEAPIDAQPLLPSTAPEPPPADQQLHVVVYIDNFNLTPFKRNQVLGELRQFLRTELSPNDEIMLATYDRELHLRHPFTNRPENITRALLELEDISAQAVHHRSDRHDVLRRIEDADSYQEAYSDAYTYAESVRNDLSFTISALRRIIDSLAGSPGRKALVYVSEGLPMIAAEEAFYAVKAVFHDRTSLTTMSEFDYSRRFEELAAAANANRVSFYTIDAAGLRVLSQGTVDYDIAGAPGERTHLDQITRSNMQSSIQLIAERTGGKAIINTNRFLPDLRRIAQDFRSYYSLGYASPNPGDGRYHRIEVRLKNPQRGWTVRHREGYRDKTVETKMHDGTLSALHLSLENNPLEAQLVFERPRPRPDGLFDVTLNVRVPYSSLVLLPQGGQHHGKIRLWLAAKDESDKMSDVQQVPQDIRLDAQDFEAAQSGYWSLPISLTMDAGYHDVAIGIRDELGAQNTFLRKGLQVG